MEEEALQRLANPTNQAILSLLAIEPAHPRRIADLLSRSESDVSRRLRRMEDTGLVASGWERRKGRNVKTYSLIPDEVTIRIQPQGLTLEAHAQDLDTTPQTTLHRLRTKIPEPETFVGRDNELTRLHDGGPILLLEGIAGIGKTSLAAAYAHEATKNKPVFFHSFSGTETLTWLAHRYGIFQARNENPSLLHAIQNAPLPDQRHLLLDALNQPERLTVLDATEKIRDEDLTTFLKDAITHIQHGTLLLTARTLPSYDPTLDTVERIHLEGLTPTEVQTLLEQENIPTTPSTATRIQRTLGGHPLAVNLLAQTAKETQKPLPQLLERLPEQGIEDYLLHEVSQHLTPTEQNTLAHASIFPGPFTTDDLQALHDTNPTGALVRLRRRRLLQGEGDRYRMHELLQTYFQERLEDPRTAHNNAAEHALNKGTLEARLDALYHLLEAGQPQRVLRLLEEDLDLEEFDLIEEGYHNLYLDILERFDPDTINDPLQAALVHDERGDIHHHRGNHEQALHAYQQARQHFTQANAQHRLADIAWKRALSLEALDRPREAQQEARKGLKDHEPDERTEKRLTRVTQRLQDNATPPQTEEASTNEP